MTDAEKIAWVQSRLRSYADEERKRGLGWKAFKAKSPTCPTKLLNNVKARTAFALAKEMEWLANELDKDNPNEGMP